MWPGISASNVPAFRDAFHFYYPQAVWLDQCAAAGEYFPLWQCNESLGVNIAGETTSALYYPLRILWLLPSLSVAQRFAIFVLAHLALAGIGMQYACVRMHLRKEAGWFSGVAFALSCPVLFQHNNLVFLSSSAWLGFAIAELSCWLFRCEANSRPPRIVVFSGALAMMVLAGDPHTAVNLCIVAVLLAASRGISRRSMIWFGKSIAWLAAGVTLAVGLSAVQSIPSLHWASQSHRWSSETEVIANHASGDEQLAAPDNEFPGQLLTILNEPVQRLPSATYEFSLSPWHVLTGMWPTLGGQFSPENARVFSLLAAEGRMWIPSLFFGVLPLLLLLGGLRREPNLKYSLFLFAAIFALLASFGNYSLGWLLRCVFDAFGAYALSSQLPPDHFSSLYGLLADWLPGYSVFRYPAKWSVIAVACATLAAAIRFDQLLAAQLTCNTRVQRLVLVLSGLGLLLSIAISLLLGSDFLARPNMAPDAWLGTPNGAAMTHQLRIAFSIPLLSLGVLAVVRWREARFAPLPVHALLAWIGLLESFVVATCWCSFVEIDSVKPAGRWQSEFVWSDVSEANIERDRWLTTSTTEASVAITNYQRAFSLGKLGLLSSQHNLASILSIEPQRIKQLRVGLAKLDKLSAIQPELDSVLAWLGVEKRLVRATEKDQQASFSWRPVPGSKPLVELRFEDPANSQIAAVRWQWIRCGQLEVEIDSPAKGRLLVRQFNDDGWQIVTDRDSTLQLNRDHSGLFIECAVESGKSRLVLQRNERPVRLGLSITGVSLLLALAVGCYQLRIASATKSRSK